MNLVANDKSLVATTEDLAATLADVFQAGGKVLICGNGGSACDAMHFAEEFTGRYRKNRPALPALALTDSAHITCVGNDFGFDAIFARGVEAFGNPGDVLIGLSTSGNSVNVIRAFETAKEKGLTTVALLGKGGGALAGKTDIEYVVPGDTADRIQEIHMAILHIVIEGVERRLFPNHYL
ncbi:MAG: D-sedoheptulose 7-phosphate isomerase [Candidatus Margulisiibacteriota bacterium]